MKIIDILVGCLNLLILTGIVLLIFYLPMIIGLATNLFFLPTFLLVPVVWGIINYFKYKRLARPRPLWQRILLGVPWINLGFIVLVLALSAWQWL